VGRLPAVAGTTGLEGSLNPHFYLALGFFGGGGGGAFVGVSAALSTHTPWLSEDPRRCEGRGDVTSIGYAFHGARLRISTLFTMSFLLLLVWAVLLFPICVTLLAYCIESSCPASCKQDIYLSSRTCKLLGKTQPSHTLTRSQRDQ